MFCILNSIKKVGLYLIILLSLLGPNKLLAQKAEIYQTVRPKVIMIGIEPELDFAPNSSTMYFHFDIAATKRLDVNLKYGVTNTSKPYYGVHLEYHFIKSDILNFAVSSGTHYRNGVLLDLTPVLSHTFQKCSVATGPEFNWKITKDKQTMLDWFFGISLPLPRSMELSVSVGFPIKDDTYWISSGWSVYF